MRSRLIITFLLVASSVLATESFEVVLNDMTDAHNNRIRFRTDSKTLAATPDWTPGSKDPPLSIAAACKIATDAGKRRLPKADDIAIDSVKLEKSDSYHKGSDGPTKLIRWYYLFTVSPIIGEQTFVGESATSIVILMDGSVIQPTPMK